MGTGTSENLLQHADSVSIPMDGKASNNLSDIEEVEDVTLRGALSGLAYVMDYRIKGSRFQHLDLALMCRLARAFLSQCPKTSGTLCRKRPTVGADLAFNLLEIEEFRRAVSELSPSDLRAALAIHRRCRSSASPEQKQVAAAIVKLGNQLPQFRDWREVVPEDEEDTVEAVLNASSGVAAATMPPSSEEDLYPPPALYFDRKPETLTDVFRTSLDKGLDEARVKDHPLVLVPAISTDRFILVACVELGFHGYKEAAVLLVVVVLNVIMGFTQEFQANRAVNALMSLTSSPVVKTPFRRNWTGVLRWPWSKSVPLAVSILPEGLVAVVTLTMALGVRRMATRNAIVRSLPSVETLGSVTVICPDKTGSKWLPTALTEGRIGAAALWATDGVTYNFTEAASLDPSQGGVTRASSKADSTLNHANGGADEHSNCEHVESETAPPHLIAAASVCAMCNNSSVALLVAAARAAFSREFWFKEIDKIGENAFDSDRKRMSVIVKGGACVDDSKPFALVLGKGAPESIMSKCTSFVAPDFKSTTPRSNSSALHAISSEHSNFTDEFEQAISEKSNKLASQGLRVLVLAVRVVSFEDADAMVKSGKPSVAEQDLVFVGLIGLIDPPKQGVREAVRECQTADIEVVMITGDHIATANRAIRGEELDLLSEEALADLRPFPNVFAPTGDGVNDAPAIKRADVGIVMGKAGTEITKQAADIVLADDDFVTIVAAVKEGRRVYDNILKFLVYLLSCNSAEIIVFLVCAAAINVDLVNWSKPFTTMMILWANIIADVPPSIALGLEPEEPKLMHRLPRPPEQGVPTWPLLITIAFQAIVMSGLTLTRYLLAYHKVIGGFTTVAGAQSLAFLLFTMMQISHVLKVHLGRNIKLILAFLVSIGFLMLGIYLTLGWQGWVVTVIGMALQLCCVETFKLIMRGHLSRKQLAHSDLP
ncbi:calcium ATPase, partial [Gonapodya prolifera JEL478]